MVLRGWSQADLARHSGIQRQVISAYINRKRDRPDPAKLVALAKGLNVSPLVVFLKAGLLDENGLPLPDMMTPEEQTLVLMFRQIPPEDQRRLLKIARCFASDDGSE